MTTGPNAALRRAVESVVEQDYRPLELVIYGNGASVDSFEGPHEADVPVRLGSSGANLGVAGGRNAAARLATGDILLFIDDDAVLLEGSLRRAVDAIRSSSAVGAVAFRIVDPDLGTPALWYYAYDPAVWSGRPFEASSVIGCGNLIRRDCFERLGGFWDGYFRELEEIELSWRLLDAGWKIRYEPEAVVKHSDRTHGEHFSHLLASNLMMFWRLFPLPLALRQSAFMLSYFLVKAVRLGRLGELTRGIALAAAGARRVARERFPLSAPTVRYLRRVHACQSFGKRLQWSLRPLPPPRPFGDQPVAVGGSFRPER